MKESLTSGGYVVAQAGDGVTALHEAHANSPDLIIPYLMLPE